MESKYSDVGMEGFRMYEREDQRPKAQPTILDGAGQPMFQQLRWHEIYTIISEEHQQLTQELKKLLTAYGMEDPKNFSIEDLFALKTISSTISKMDEVLAHFSKF